MLDRRPMDEGSIATLSADATQNRTITYSPQGGNHACQDRSGVNGATIFTTCEFPHSSAVYATLPPDAGVCECVVRRGCDVDVQRWLLLGWIRLRSTGR